MNSWLELLPGASANWTACLWRATWQGSLGLIAVWLICRVVPTMPARYQSWLWRLAFVKFVIVLVWTTPIELPLLPVGAAPADSERPVATVSLDEHSVAEVASSEYSTIAGPVGADAPSQPAGLGRTSDEAMPATRSGIRQNFEASHSRKSVTVSAAAESGATSATGGSFLPTLLTGLVIVWLAGVFWYGTLFFRGWLAVRRLRRNCQRLQDDDLTETLHGLCKEFGWSRRPVLLEREGGGSAFLVGVFRPAIVVPSELRAVLGPNEIRMALAHELAHVQRWDLAWSAVAAMTRVLFFFHPFVWWASRRLDLAQEIAADQLALRRFPDQLARYAEVLLTVVNQPQPSSILPGLAAGAASHYQTLRRRIVAMKSFHHTPFRVVIVSAVLVSLLAALGMVPWRLVAAEEAGPVAVVPAVKSDPVKLTPAQEKILQSLQEPARIEFIETPLSQVIQFAQDRHKLDLRLDDEALRAASIDSDAPVTANLQRVNVNNALWLMLRDLGLKHVIRGNGLLITTPPGAERVLRAGGIDPDRVDMWRGNRDVIHALAHPTMLEFIETPLQDVIDYLKDLHQIDMRIDHRAFREARLGSDTPVTINFGSVTLNSALRWMLDEIGATHVISHGVLLITTPKHRDRLLASGGFEPDDIRFSPRNKSAFRALARKTKLEFINTPLQDVADYLKDLHSTKIRLDQRALETAGMRGDLPVTKKLHGVTLHSALQEMLGQLGLTHVVQHEVILITTSEGGRRRLDEGALVPTDTAPDKVKSAPTIEKALRAPVTVACREKPLSQVAEILKKQSGVEIRIDDWELATAGVTRDVACTVTVTELPLESALQQLLRGLGLGYIVEDDLVIIVGREIVDRLAERTPDMVAYVLRRKGATVVLRGEYDDPYIASVRHLRVTDDVFDDLKGLSRLRELGMSGPDVTDARLAHLKNLPQLQKLELRGIPISGAGLVHLAELKDLRYLNLEQSGVTDEGLEHIQGLTELRELHLSQTNVTDAGLRYLANLKHLEVLLLPQVTGTGLEHLAGHERLWRLTVPGVSGAALEHLAGCTRLRTLRLSGSDVTDADLEHLKGLSQLEYLTLACPNVSDAGLKHLAGLNLLKTLNLNTSAVTGVGLSHVRAPKLRILYLGKSQVTDAGLAHLKPFTNLWMLDLSSTKISDEAVVPLREWLQNVRAAQPPDNNPFGEGGRSARVNVRDTKFTRPAAAKLRKDFPSLRISGYRLISW